MSNIISMAEATNDNKFCDIAQMLRDAADEIESGKRKANKVLVLTLFDEEGAYHNGFYAANMRGSEMLALSTHSAAWFNRMLDGIDY